MRILLVGGGSGGHVTPLKALLPYLTTKEVREIRLITDRKFAQQTRYIFADKPEVKIKVIFAGKYRRYHGHSFLWHITHLPTLLYNLRDIFFLSLGFMQSCSHFLLHRPDVVCAKGGFVSLPVGVAAKLFRVPLVIHDSDTHPGLTSRVLSRWARVIATGMPPEYYPYPKSKMKYIGIPVDSRFKPTDRKTSRGEKGSLGFDPKRPLMLVTGGGTGAQRLNDFFAGKIPQLIESGWSVALMTGKGKATLVKKQTKKLDADQLKHCQIHEFTDLVPYVLAADIIVTRAGASAMQEFANSKKTVVVVPSPMLSGGHQVKNAEMFDMAKAALYVKEADLYSGKQSLLDIIASLEENDGSLDRQLSSNLYKQFARPDAAKQLAQLIIDSAKRS